MKTVKMILGIIGMFVLASVAVAGSGGQYVLEWSTINGGGGQSSGGQYSLTGTIGQPEAGEMAGGDYEVLGGFWAGGPLCFVGIDDFARFASYWLDSEIGSPADLYIDGSNTVNHLDLNLFIKEWLYECPYGWPLK